MPVLHPDQAKPPAEVRAHQPAAQDTITVDEASGRVYVNMPVGSGIRRGDEQRQQGAAPAVPAMEVGPDDPRDPSHRPTRDVRDEVKFTVTRILDRVSRGEVDISVVHLAAPVTDWEMSRAGKPSEIQAAWDKEQQYLPASARRTLQQALIDGMSAYSERVIGREDFATAVRARFREAAAAEIQYSRDMKTRFPYLHGGRTPEEYERDVVDIHERAGRLKPEDVSRLVREIEKFPEHSMLPDPANTAEVQAFADRLFGYGEWSNRSKERFIEMYANNYRCASDTETGWGFIVGTALLSHESNNNPKAVSNLNPEVPVAYRAMGLGQFIPGTARAYGLDVPQGYDPLRDGVDPSLSVFDPYKCGKASHEYLRDLGILALEYADRRGVKLNFEQTLIAALVGYNAGPDDMEIAIDRFQESGIMEVPNSMRDYPQTVGFVRDITQKAAAMRLALSQPTEETQIAEAPQDAPAADGKPAEKPAEGGQQGERDPGKKDEKKKEPFFQFNPPWKKKDK